MPAARARSSEDPTTPATSTPIRRSASACTVPMKPVPATPALIARVIGAERSGLRRPESLPACELVERHAAAGQRGGRRVRQRAADGDHADGDERARDPERRAQGGAVVVTGPGEAGREALV